MARSQPEKPLRLMFATLAARLDVQYGALLERCTEDKDRAIGRSAGAWKSGFQVRMAGPGLFGRWLHFKTLREVEKAFKPVTWDVEPRARLALKRQRRA